MVDQLNYKECPVFSLQYLSSKTKTVAWTGYLNCIPVLSHVICINHCSFIRRAQSTELFSHYYVWHIEAAALLHHPANQVPKLKHSNSNQTSPNSISPYIKDGWNTHTPPHRQKFFIWVFNFAILLITNTLNFISAYY